MQDEDYILWMISDSALPTGGFVCSAGLEAAIQSLHVVTSEDLDEFINDSLTSLTHSSLLFAIDAYNISHRWRSVIREESNEGIDNSLERLLLIDRRFGAMTTNHVTRRSSQSQGSTFLNLLSRGFPLVQSALHSQFTKVLRLNKTPGNFPICFGMCLEILGVSFGKMKALFLFLAARSLVSSAVRLNLVGPYKGNMILMQAREHIQTCLSEIIIQFDEDGTSLASDKAIQTSPLLDIIQGFHDRLYSRMFNS